MKRSTALVLIATALVAGAVPAGAAPAKAKPVKTTLYFHGNQPVAEAGLPDSLLSGAFEVMDTTAPTGSSPKTYGVTNYGAGPNTECAGNPLFPVWVGEVSGTPTGDAVVDLHLTSAGTGKLLVRLFNDVGGLSCNESYVPPIGEATVDLVNGATTAKVVLKGINKKKRKVSSLMLQVSPAASVGAPFVSRVSYDATSAMSRLTFTCIPRSGKRC